MLAVGSEGVFPDLLLIFFMSFFAFFHNTPTPIFLPPLHICIQERQTLFILPSMLLHHFVSSVERWGQEAKSLTSFHATRMGENYKFMANKEVLSCKLKQVQSRAIWQSLLPPSELSHFKISLCFPPKIGNLQATGWETSIEQVELGAGSSNPPLFCIDLLPICCFYFAEEKESSWQPAGRQSLSYFLATIMNAGAVERQDQILKLPGGP